MSEVLKNVTVSCGRISGSYVEVEKSRNFEMGEGGRIKKDGYNEE